MKYKAIIFDLWNTLAYNKSKKVYYNLIDFISEKLGDNYKNKLYRENISEKQMIKDMKLFSSYSDSKTLDSLIRKNKTNFALYSDTLPSLQKLKENYKLGLLSNTTSITTYNLDKSKIIKHLNSITLSFNTGYVKPEAKIYDIALNSLGCQQEDTLFVGDSIEADYTGPIKMGMDAILLDRKNKHKNIENKITSLKDILKKLD